MQGGNYLAIKSRSGDQSPLTLTGILGVILPVHYWNGWIAPCPLLLHVWDHFCLPENASLNWRIPEGFIHSDSSSLTKEGSKCSRRRWVKEAAELIHHCMEDVVRAQNTGKAQGWEWWGHTVTLCLKLQSSMANLVMFSCWEVLVMQQQSQIFGSTGQMEHSLIYGCLVRSKHVFYVGKEMYKYKAENTS